MAWYSNFEVSLREATLVFAVFVSAKRVSALHDVGFHFDQSQWSYAQFKQTVATQLLFLLKTNRSNICEDCSISRPT